MALQPKDFQLESWHGFAHGKEPTPVPWLLEVYGDWLPVDCEQM